MSLSIDVENIRKSDNNFSFLSTIFDLVGNRSFMQDYSNRLSAMNGIDSDKSNIWITLSAIGQQVGGAFQENVNNYIDNLINIDTCNIQGLESLSKILGTNYNIFSTLKTFPIDIINIINVMSISKEYLVNSYKINSLLANQIKISCNIPLTYTESCISVTNLSRADYLSDDTLSNEWDTNALSGYKLKIDNSLSVDTITDLLSCTLFDFINCKLNMTYNDLSNTKICDNLSNSILLSGFELPNDKAAEINILKLRYNIPKDFNVEKEADNIDNGMTEYDSYSVPLRKVLDLEFERRHEAFDANQLSTRNKYYKQKEVKEYYNFVTNECSLFENAYLSSNSYDVDNEYFLLSGNYDIQIYLKDTSNKYSIDTKYVNIVVQKILYIVNSLRSIRQTLRFFCQKNFMKGSFLLISYLINEYLKTSTYYNINRLIANGTINSDLSAAYDPNLNYSEIITYIDPLNYFNISTDVDNMSLSSLLNVRYWESSSAVKASNRVNSTNIFTIPPVVDANSFSFGIEDLSAFYCNNLKMQFSKYKLRSKSEMNKAMHLTLFLNNIFDVGADKTYYDDNISAIATFVDDLKLVPYKNELYYNYTGNLNGENPFYYYANTRHPSYMIHPNMMTFMEVEDYSYPIENIASVVKDEVISLIKNNIDEYIDDDGYIINMWKNPLASNNDYLTRYESQSNLNTWLNYDPVVAYDGLFYLPAVKQLAENFNDVIELLKNGNPSKTTGTTTIINYYYGLVLTDNEKTKISCQLTNFKELIISEATNDYTERHTITRYGLDMYLNAYILVKPQKKYESDQILETGLLWIRLKNHPIAFPAFSIDSNDKYNNNLAQIHQLYQDDGNNILETNNVITNTAAIDNRDIPQHITNHNYPKIQDFFIAINKQDVLINFVDKTHSAINTAIHTVIQKYDNDTDLNYLQLNKVNYSDNFAETKELLFSNSFNANFGCFYNNNNNPGIILYKVNDASNICIYSAYFNTVNYTNAFVDDITANVKLDISIYRPNANTKYDIHLDATNDNMFSIAYVGDTDLKTVKTYLDNTYDYSNNNDYNLFITEKLNKCIVTKTFDIYAGIYEKNTEDAAYKYKNSQIYNCYTDCGFFGLFGKKSQNVDNNFVNDITTSMLSSELNERGILKFLILGISKTNRIDFKLCLPVIMQEGYNSSGLTSTMKTNAGDLFTVTSFKKAHFLEDQVAATTGNNIEITDYFNPSEVNKILNGKNATLKLNEDFFKDIGTAESYKETYSLFNDAANGPYIVVDNIPHAYHDYPSTSFESDAGTDTCFFKIKTGCSNLSVSYFKNETNILLDFNTYYYKNKPSKITNNYFNKHHLFLNIANGEAGYLNTYDSNGNYEATYYIKNVSDAHPKFILSVVKEKTT